jgi:DNA-binding CsgD family transcriptional regulator
VVRRRHLVQGRRLRGPRDDTVQMAALLLRALGSHGAPTDRLRRLATFPGTGQREIESWLKTHTSLGAQFAERVGLGAGAADAILRADEQWDGKGPRHLRGDQIPLPARLVSLSGIVEVIARRHGVTSAESVVRKHAGKLFDPGLAEVFVQNSGPLLDGGADTPTWEQVMDAEPGSHAGWRVPSLDGSGYPRGLTAASLTSADRLLAAADVYHAMTEPRPHRPALAADEAAAQLQTEVRTGRLDGDAVGAVLRAAGHRAPARREGPAGLTAREVEVLALLARGHATKEIARRLGVTTKTASNHVEHVYTKLGVGTRAAATLFATQHGLVGSFEPAR